MNHMEISFENEGDHQKLLAKKNGQIAGEMIFSTRNNKMIIKHTEVDDKWQGEGVGRKLIDAIVKIAREKQMKILPLCTYAKHVFDEDPTISDVL